MLTKSRRILDEMSGIKLARLRRKFSSAQVADYANISRPILSSIEKGNLTESIGPHSAKVIRSSDSVSNK